MSWAAQYSLAVEINQTVINTVLDKFLQSLQTQLSYNASLGRIGSFDATLKDLAVLDLMATGQPGGGQQGGVKTELQAKAEFRLALFGWRIINTTMTFTIEGVEIDLSKSPAGLPKGIVITVKPSLSVKIKFQGSNFIVRSVLNGIIAPFVSFGIWLSFKIIRRVEIVIWELIDIFGVLGLKFMPNSPLLTAQDAVPPTSLLLASDFNFGVPASGLPVQLKHFIPQNTNIGAVVNDKVINSAVQLAFIKGWAPSRFKISKWKIFINYINVGFDQDKIVVNGSLKAKRGKCWCRVKARITYKVEILPKAVVTPSPLTPALPVPRVHFVYNANVNSQISSSGMLSVLGVVMFTPALMSMTVSMSFLINIVLNQFLPYSTSWNQGSANIMIKANSVNYSGYAPLTMNFPLQLSGNGYYDLSNFTQFQLPNNGPQLQVKYTDESLSLQSDELRVAIDLQ